MAKLHDKFMNRIIEGKLELGSEETPEVVGALKGQDISVNELDATTAKIFENIVDKDGHKRFIEGELEILNQDLVTKYAKWSLSGTHLMVVYAGYIPANTTMNTGTWFKLKDLPQWAKDKIFPTFGSYLELKGVNARDDNLENSITIAVALIKNNNDVYTSLSSRVTTTAKANFRISWDILIDNE